MIQSPELAAATNQTEKAILPLDQRPLAGQAKSIGEASFFEGWVHGPIIQVFKGPGRGYRKFDVLEKGEKVTLYKVKTSWVQISNKRIQSGWIRTADLPRIIDTNGYPLSLSKPK